VEDFESAENISPVTVHEADKISQLHLQGLIYILQIMVVQASPAARSALWGNMERGSGERDTG
jgi:hypothetical protein